MRTTMRRLVRRFAWLMLGGAIGLAAALLGFSVVQAAVPGLPVWTVAALVTVAAAALGLVPGARELEVTAARAMLGAEAEMVVPRRSHPVHRRRTVAWVLVHLVLGLAVAACLFAVVPFAALVVVEAVAGRVAGSELPLPASPPEQVLRVVGGVALGVAAALAAWPAGAAAAGLAGRVLGPTAHDRLEVALDRASREAEHVRLARELHDGIGHALTIVSVQAAAGRRVVEHDPATAAEALAAVEETARAALAELDELLAVLREDRPGPDAPVDLEGVVAAHRRAGLDLDVALDVPDGLPAVVRRNLHRIVSEALTNAHRHGAPGPVRLVVSHTEDAVTVEASNPVGRRRARPGGGRGLAGIAERVALFGGSVDAGPAGDRWVLRATLPRPERSTDG